MELRSSTWAATIRLAIVLSAVAVLVAVAFRDLLAQPVIVLAVILIGFATSWVRTERLARGGPSLHRHRVVTVPVRHVPVG